MCSLGTFWAVDKRIWKTHIEKKKFYIYACTLISSNLTLMKILSESCRIIEGWFLTEKKLSVMEMSWKSHGIVLVCCASSPAHGAILLRPLSGMSKQRPHSLTPNGVFTYSSQTPKDPKTPKRVMKKHFEFLANFHLTPSGCMTISALLTRQIHDIYPKIMVNFWKKYSS